MMLGTPCWVPSERSRTAGAAAGISGRVIFAACWAGMPIKAFAKIATPRSVLTEVLSKLAIKMNRIYLEYPYHIIAFFDLLETP